jgi:cytoskeletal protein RodZ
MSEPRQRKSRHQRPLEIIGVLAATGALGLGGPAAVSSACPEHDNSDSSSNTKADSGNANPGASNSSAGKTAKAKSATSNGGAKAGPASSSSSSKNQGSDTACAAGSTGSQPGPCNSTR